MSKEVRYLTLTGAVNVAAIRTATFNGVEHVVVPVVALMEGVIWPVNAETPELVLASELAVAPAGWNGRPVLPDHPSIDDERVSANDPRILETQAFGQVFEAHMEGKKLCMEAWLNPARAAAVGELAQKVIARANEGKVIEVSVGVFVTAEAKSGEYGGKKYKYVWHNIVPDHLAMLPEGVTGACSVEMGCGAPRAARHRVNGDEIELENTMTEPVEKRSLRERLFSLMRIRNNAGVEADMSDQDLRNTLDTALRAVEPGYLGLDAVFPADSQVVYAVAPEQNLLIFRRGYSLSKGEATLKDDREEVHLVQRYEPVTAQQREEEPPASCGCGTATKVAAATEAGGSMKDKATRIKDLIACPKTPFKDVDEAMLQACSEDRLTEFETHYAAQPMPATEPKVAAAAPTASAATTVTPTATVPQTEEQFLATAPDSIKTIVAEHKAAQVAKRTGLLATLKGKQNGFTEAELNELPTPMLEKLAKALEVPAAVIDFSGRAVPRENASGGNAPAPPSLTAKIQGRK